LNLLLLKKPKIKAKLKSLWTNLSKRVKKVSNQNFQGQTPSKKAKFGLFCFAQGQIATMGINNYSRTEQETHQEIR